MDPATGLPDDQKPDHADSASMVLIVLNRIMLESSTGSAGLLNFLRRGADVKTLTEEGQSILHALIAPPRPSAVSYEKADARTARFKKIMGDLLDAGVSPFLEDRAGIYAYEAAMASPEIAPLFREKCALLDERLRQFRPAADHLLDAAGKPTELLKYACATGRLGEILKLERWSKPQALVKTKNELTQTLPHYYREKYAADLDCAATRRAAVEQTENPLARHLNPMHERSGGKGA